VGDAVPGGGGATLVRRLGAGYRSFRICPNLRLRSVIAGGWPRELRHSFVSLMSDAGVPIEKIARLVGHTGTTTTETVYRKQIRPVVMGGAEIMDSLFPKAPAGHRLATLITSLTLGWAALGVNRVVGKRAR
jgi:hypothetical protein